MSSEPTPLSRLLRLENAIEQLIAANLPNGLQQHVADKVQPAAIWPADELLITRLLRRTPEVLQAYQSPAELTDTSAQGLHLSIADSKTFFHYCELIDGDAVVWLDAKAPEWAWNSQIFRHLFSTPTDLVEPSPLVLQSLPLFKPIARGLSWTLHRRGEMVLQARQFPEQADRASLLRRIENLERELLQHRIKLTDQIHELQIKVRVQQTTIDRFSRVMLFGPDSLTDHI